jgi:tRNA nucleotidyltransferase/poly(A) polymerase
MMRLGLEAYEVGGWVRDELSGKDPKDLDLAICGLTYDQLEAALKPHGFVIPNIVGGGKLGLRVRDGATQGELLKPKKDEDYRSFYDRVSADLPATSVAEPEVYDGEGRLVGCRLQASWTPPGGIEISLARTEASTDVGRANFRVELDPELSIEHDLGRRDFTVNAMARNLATGELVDPYGGEADLKAGVLRVVSDESFREDPSRMIRGLARIAKDGLSPDEHTLAEMRKNAHLLDEEPVEQLYLDLAQTLAGPHAAQAMRVARDTGVLQTIIPEFTAAVGFAQESQYHALSCDEHILLALEEVCKNEGTEAARWAALLHDLGKPASSFRGADGHLHFYSVGTSDPVTCPACQREVRVLKDGRKELVSGESPCDHCGTAEFGLSHEEIGARYVRQALGRLKQPQKELVSKVELLVREHMYRDDVKLEPLRARKFIRRVGRDNVEELMVLRRADRAAKDTDGLSATAAAELTAWEELVRQEMEAPLYVRELAISGHDAMAFGYAGPAIGEVLEDLLVQVVADPKNNERERLLGWLARRAVKSQRLPEAEAEELVAARIAPSPA